MAFRPTRPSWAAELAIAQPGHRGARGVAAGVSRHRTPTAAVVVLATADRQLPHRQGMLTL